MNLRTSRSSGHSYQLIDKSDFSSGVLKDIPLYAEIGTAYFNEDFTIAQDKSCEPKDLVYPVVYDERHTNCRDHCRKRRREIISSS